jgi:ABC-type lipoprotein release transport system permease subunit
LSLAQTLYWQPYMAKFQHKTNNNQSYTLENWYGESRLWQKAIWLESKSLYVTKFSIELTAAS